jgi:hypothetical protein
MKSGCASLLEFSHSRSVLEPQLSPARGGLHVYSHPIRNHGRFYITAFQPLPLRGISSIVPSAASLVAAATHGQSHLYNHRGAALFRQARISLNFTTPISRTLTFPSPPRQHRISSFLLSSTVYMPLDSYRSSYLAPWPMSSPRYAPRFRMPQLRFWGSLNSN